MSNISIVHEKFSGVRVDNYIFNQLKGAIAKPHLHKIIRTGQVRVNGSRVKSSSRVQANDKVRIPPFLNKREDNDQSWLKGNHKVIDLADYLLSNIIYEDKGLLVINKPSGVAVHGGSGVDYGVIEALRSTEKFHDLELVHRLDRDTSGCLILAKKRSYLRTMHEYLRAQGLIQKKYLALCSGSPNKDNFSIDKSLLKIHDKSGQWRVIVHSDGKSSKTKVRTLKRLDEACLLECNLITGRTHQLRVHLASEDLPIIGDDRYGYKEENTYFAKKLKTNRLFLHAKSIKIHNYMGGDDLYLESKIPDDFDSAMLKIEGNQ